MLSHSHALFYVAVFIISILGLRVLEQIIGQLRREEEDRHARRWTLAPTGEPYHRPVLTRHAGQRGQALIESVIVLPLAFLFFLACLDVALAVEDLGALQHAATQTAICSVNAICTDPAEFARQSVRGIGFFDSSQLQTTVTCSSPAICNASLAYPFSPLGPLLKPLVLTRSAQAVKTAS